MTEMLIETVSVYDLKLDPKNARKHDKKNLFAMQNSLGKFGQQKPIVVDRDNVVIAGNGMLMAARALGVGSLKVKRFEGTKDEALAYALADNRTAELSEWDTEILRESLRELNEINFDVSGIGFDLRDFGILDINTEEGTEGLTDPDAIPEDVETRCKSGDLWLLESHKLLCGDSTNAQHVNRLMGGDKAELCFTSPPYADQREYNGGKILSTEHLAKFISVAFGQCSYFAVNLGISRKGGEVSQYWDDYIKEAKARGLKLLSWNVWDRSGFGGSIGNQTAMFPIWHEWVLVFGDKPKEINRTKVNKSAGSKSGTNRNADGTTQPGNGVTGEFGKIGTVIKTGMADGSLHPAMFPVEFPKTYIDACTNPREVVYEPFAGSGSTLIACEQTGRKCFSMELDPAYCDIILKRWEDFTGKQATLASEA